MTDQVPNRGSEQLRDQVRPRTSTVILQFLKHS
jgi:hypothetical protein